MNKFSSNQTNVGKQCLKFKASTPRERMEVDVSVQILLALHSSATSERDKKRK